VPRVTELLIQIVGGFIVGGSLGLVGAGGAILCVPIFAVLLGHESKDAVAEALVVTCIVATVSALRAASARQVDWTKVALVGIPGMIGSALGGWAAHWLNDFVQMALFAALALVAAWRMVAQGEPHEAATRTRSSETMERMAAVGVGGGIGVFTGLVGVGGGFLLVPALSLLLRLPMRLAIGTSLSIIALNSAVGFVGNRVGDPRDVHPDWQAVAVVALCGVIGSLAGARISQRLPQHVLRRVFAALLVVVALVTLLHQWSLVPGSPA
jgi:uncharacterized membrane protein YfcA